MQIDELARLIQKPKIPTAEECARALPNYLVCTPYWGAVDMDHLDSVMAMRRLYPQLKSYRIQGCSYIDIARATLCRQVEVGGYDGIMFIDHDVVFWPPDVPQLIETAEAEACVVSGIYSMRTTGDRMIGCFDASVKKVRCFEGGGLYPAPYSGLGFTAIPRKVLDDVGRDLPLLKTGFSECRPMFALRCEASDGWYSGEDISFFHRVKQAGHRLLCDTRPRLFHKGTYMYGLEDVQIAVPRARTLDLQLVPLDGENERPGLYAADAGRFVGSWSDNTSGEGAQRSGGPREEFARMLSGPHGRGDPLSPERTVWALQQLELVAKTAAE